MLLRAPELDFAKGFLRAGSDGAALRAWRDSEVLVAWREPLRGARVALVCRDNYLLALGVLALDGVASRLLLIPSGLSADGFGELLRKSEADFIISDSPEFPRCGVPGYALPPVPGMGSTRSERAQLPPVTTEWVLATSGTTRTPKLVSHTVGSLTRTVRRDTSRGTGVVWGLLYDLNRFAGLQVFFQALLGGSLLVIPSPGESLGATLAGFASAGVNALSATPTLWRKLLMTPGVEALPLRRITLGGEIADKAVIAALATRFPSARITHIYASTEAGVGFSVSDGEAGFPASYLHGGLPGVGLRINAEGVLEIRSAATGRRYLGETDSFVGDDGFVNTGDRVRIEGDRVYFLGRVSGTINVGGNKVTPEEVEQVLLAHPAVALASVGAKRSGVTGALVTAHVVLREVGADPKGVAAELRAWCAVRLERHKVPALIHIVDRLEAGPAGKITRL